MADILITEFMDESAVDALRGQFDVDYDPALADAQGDIPARLAGARAIIVRNRTKVTADMLDAAPDVKCVGRLGVGLDNIDMDAAKARGVTVYPALGANTLSVSEYVLTTAAVLLRTAYFSNAAMIAGDWPRGALGQGRELSGRTLGLVGFGEIARDCAARAAALGCRIAAFDPFLPADHPAWEIATRMDLNELLASADIVSLHVPLTDGTRHLINADTLATMKPDAILVNAARGGVVDETALAHALREGRLGGAALDTFEVEPLTAEAGEKFKGLTNLILTPHIGGVTADANTRVSAMIADLVRDHLNQA